MICQDLMYERRTKSKFITLQNTCTYLSMQAESTLSCVYGDIQYRCFGLQKEGGKYGRRNHHAKGNVRNSSIPQDKDSPAFKIRRNAGCENREGLCHNKEKAGGVDREQHRQRNLLRVNQNQKL